MALENGPDRPNLSIVEKKSDAPRRGVLCGLRLDEGCPKTRRRASGPSRGPKECFQINSGMAPTQELWASAHKNLGARFELKRLLREGRQ